MLIFILISTIRTPQDAWALKLSTSGKSQDRIIESLPTERVSSGSPPEGGVDFGKAPLGLFIHQILNPVVLFHYFLAHECNCVWFLHPTLMCLHNIPWPKNAGQIHAFVLKLYGGSIQHLCILEIQLQKLCYTLVEH